MSNTRTEYLESAKALIDVHGELRLARMSLMRAIVMHRTCVPDDVVPKCNDLLTRLEQLMQDSMVDTIGCHMQKAVHLTGEVVTFIKSIRQYF